jgi:hypothetical protein
MTMGFESAVPESAPYCNDRRTGLSLANSRRASVTSMIIGVVPATAASSAALNSRPCTIVKPSVLKESDVIV